MIWHHGTPDAYVVFLLLMLLFIPSEPHEDCVFQYPPIDSSSNFQEQAEELEQYLLLDYEVQVPSNLKEDELCQELWKLHFKQKVLERLSSVSGASLKNMISHMMGFTKFIEECRIEDSCVAFTKMNISEFLHQLSSNLEALRHQIKDDGTVANFSSCTIVQCQQESFITPNIEITGEAQQSIKASAQSSLPPQPGRSYWGLILIPCFLIFLIFIWRIPCRGLFQRQPRFQEIPLEQL